MKGALAYAVSIVFRRVNRFLVSDLFTLGQDARIKFTYGAYTVEL